MDSINGEMKLTNFKDDFDFSNPNYFKDSDEEDKKQGIDFWICNIPIAYRQRRKKCPDDITIRYKRPSKEKTEYNKILDGTLKAKLFLFNFEDKIIFSTLESIKSALLNNKFTSYANTDGTWFVAIDLENIRYFECNK